jgi:anti-sigma factor RsiW
MSFALGSRSRHLEDADLVRYMDRQLERGARRRIELHLFACAECAGRLQAMEARSHGLSALLGALDAPAPTDDQRALAMAAVQRARFRARPLAAVRTPLAAAAMVALLLTAAFGTPPGRAWVSGAVDRLGGILPGRAEQAPALDAPAAGTVAAADVQTSAGEAEPGVSAAPQRVPQRPRRPVLPPGMSEPLAFNPPGNYVLLRFDARQRVGAVSLWIGDIQAASGQVIAGRRGETLVATPDGMRVRNSAASSADYSVQVPNRYRFVRVQVGDEPEQVIEVSRSRRPWIWTVSLTAESEG